jgi:hypothetical protein
MARFNEARRAKKEAVNATPPTDLATVLETLAQWLRGTDAAQLKNIILPTQGERHE